VSKLTTDVVTYCTEASNQKSKYVNRKILFYKKALHVALILDLNLWPWQLSSYFFIRKLHITWKLLVKFWRKFTP